VTSFDNAVNFTISKPKGHIHPHDRSVVNPNGIAITPDGSRAYVTSFTNVNPVIIIIDIAAKKVIASMPTIALRTRSFAHTDGSQLWSRPPSAPRPM